MKILGIKKRYWIILGIILFIVLFLFAVPRVARWYVVKKSPELIGRKLTIDKIRLNYFTGTLSINDLRLFESDSQTVFASFKLLKVSLRFLPLFKNEISVKNFSLDDPYIEVLQTGDKFNFSSILKSDILTPQKDTIPGKPLKYYIDDIRINRGYVKYTDERLNNTIAIDKIDLLIPGFTWNSDSTKLGLNLDFVAGGGLNSTLAIDLPDSTYWVKLKLDSLNLDMVEPYVHDNMHISDLQGYLSSDILIKGNMKSVLQLFVRGVNHVFDFQLIDTLKRTVLAFKDLTAEIDTFQLEKNRISLNYVGLTDPSILFEMKDSTNNWLELIKSSSPQQDTAKQPSVKTNAQVAGSYYVSKLLISGGKVNFSDKTLRFPFDYTIDNLKMESVPVSNNAGKYSLKVSAGLNKTGYLTADALLDPTNMKDLDISFAIKQFRMKDLDAYLKHYFGFSVTAGILNFDTENKLRTPSLVGNNSIYLRRFTLADYKNKDSKYHIPLRLAIAILSDKDGIIDLKAPIELKGEEVKIRNLGKIIFRAIGNLFVKAATAPFKMLAGLFKVDPESIQQITLGLSEPSPDNKNMNSVNVLADILIKKPSINIDFIYCIDTKKATDTLAYFLAMNDYIEYSKSKGVNPVNVADSTLIRYLQSKVSSVTLQGTGNISSLCRSYIGDEKLMVKLDSIKTMQTNFMMNYLSQDKAIASDRFRIIAPAPDSIKYTEAFPSFRTYFTASGENQK